MLEISVLNDNIIGMRYMNKKETLKKCSICKKPLPGNKLTFSYCCDDWLCLNCYKNNFSPTPMHPTPIFLKTS